jgi:hypothetical protein
VHYVLNKIDSDKDSDKQSCGSLSNSQRRIKTHNMYKSNAIVVSINGVFRSNYASLFSIIFHQNIYTYS